MILNKKHCLIFLTIFLVLILGTAVVSATDDTNNTQGVTDNKELSTPANYDVDNMVQSSIAETKLDANVEKTTNSDNEDNNYTKTITKKTQTGNTKKVTYNDVEIDPTSYEDIHDTKLWNNEGPKTFNVNLYHTNGGDKSDIDGELLVNIAMEDFARIPVTGGVATVSINYNDLPENNYVSQRIELTYYAPTGYQSSTKTFKLIKGKVDDADLTTIGLTRSASTVKVGQQVKISGTVKFEDTQEERTILVYNATMQLIAGDKDGDIIEDKVLYETHTDTNGYYEFKFTASKPIRKQFYFVRILYEGISEVEIDKKTNIVVQGADTYNVINATNITIGQNTTINGSVYNAVNHEILKDGIVNINISHDGKNVHTQEGIPIDENGIFTINYNATNVGEHTVIVTFPRYDVYAKSVNTTTFNVLPRKTNMTIVTNDNLCVGDDLIVSGLLYDEFDEPVVNTAVNISVGDEIFLPVYVDDNGHFEQKFTIRKNGTYTVKVEYVNNTDYYVGSINNTSCQINKIPTITNVTVINDKLYNVTLDVLVRENHTNHKNIIESGFINVTVGDKSKLYPVSMISTRIILDDIVNITTTDPLDFKVEYVENEYYYNSTGVNSTTGEVITEFTAAPLSSNITVFVTPSVQNITRNVTISGEVVDEYGNIVEEGNVTISFNDTVSVRVPFTGGRYEYNITTGTLGLNVFNVTFEPIRTQEGNILIMESKNGTSFMVDKLATVTNVTLLNSSYGNVTFRVNVTEAGNNSKFVSTGVIYVYDFTNSILLVQEQPVANNYVDLTLPLGPGINKLLVYYQENNIYLESNYRNESAFALDKDVFVINVLRIPSITNIEEVISNKSGEVAITVSVTDMDDTLVLDGHVQVFDAISGELLGEGDLEYGRVDIELPSLTEPGEALINVTYNGNTIYLPSNAKGNTPGMENTTTITVVVDPSISIELDKNVTVIGETVTVSGVVLNETGQKATSGRVIVTINDEDYNAVFDTETGEYTYTYTPTSNGTVTVNASYTKEGIVAATSSNLELLVNKINSTTTIIRVVNNTFGNVSVEISVEGADGNTSMTGKLNITVDGIIPVKADYTGKSIIMQLGDHITRSGLINVLVEYPENDVYYGSSAETNIPVDTQVPVLQLAVENGTVEVGSNAVIIGNLSDINGNEIIDAYIEISINDALVATVRTDATGKFRYEYTTNETGENIPVKAVYRGDNIRYDEASNTTQFNVIKNTDYNISVSAENITYGEIETITVSVPSDATGSVKISIIGTDISEQVPVTNSQAKLDIEAYKLPVNEYTVNVEYSDDNYATKTNTTLFNISKAASSVDVTAVNITKGYDETITVTLPEYEHANGNISVRIIKDNEIVDEYVIESSKLSDDGVNVSTVEKLGAGEYTVNVTFTNDTNYNDSTKTVQFNVALPEISIFDSTTIMINESALLHGTVNDPNANPLTGSIRLNINGSIREVSPDEYAKGISQVFTKAGTYTVNASYILDDEVIVTSENIIVTVNKIPTTTTITVENNKVGNTILNVTVTDHNNQAVTSGTLKVTTPTETKTIPVTGNTTNIPITTTADGTVTVTIEYTENNEYYNSTQKTEITVNKINTTITVNVTTPVKSGEKSTITGVLLDEDKQAISGATVLVKVDGKAITNTTTDNNGKYTASVDESIVGTHNVEASYAGDNKYFESQDTTTLTVEKLGTKLTINTTKPVRVDENIEVSGKLSDENNKAISSATVQVNYDGNIKNVTTDKDGNYKTSFPVTNTDKETVTATFIGNNKYTASQAETSSKADKNTATAQVELPKDVKVGQPANITGKITNNNGKALANMPVTVTVNGKPVRTITDENGEFQVEVNPTEGTNTVKVTAGDEDYSIDDVSGTFNANKSQAKVTVDPIKDAELGKPTSVTGKVTDEDGEPLANMPVTVDVNGKPVRTVTDDNGNFRLEVTPTEGTNTIKVNAGDKAYKSDDTTTKFTAHKPEAKVTINPITDKKVGEPVTITGKLVDDENKAITNAPVKVTVNNNTITAITGTNGNYQITTSDTLAGTNNVTVKYEDTKYDTKTAKTTFKATKTKVKVTVLSINGTLGEEITLTARITDENGRPVNGGNLVFKMNGKTLRTDGKFNSNSTPYKFKVENGIVTYTMTADKFIRDGKNLTASYSGSYKYEQAKANTASVNIRKRTAQATVTVTPKKTRQNNDIVFTATLKDVTSNARNKTCLTENANLIFKLNGITIKDSKGQAQRLPVTSSVVNYVYHVSTGMGGYDSNGLKNYTVEAVYDNPVFYPGTRNSSVFHVERSEVKVNFIKTTIKRNVLSVKATFKDFENKYLVGTNKVCVKINGKTYQENGKVKYFNVKNGRVDLKGIKISSGQKVKEVMLVTGAREGYLGARATTTDITFN
ncbi:Ig-like domain repeat protein [Methanosphaera sp. ISO3-F5]|uniref:Ig-like domain repeat protein n=1 Tax=Methanosphaera sp. ISO3-F5 TaxID=1452353 RepID=UPI002B25CCB6|nr:Ig-like domain repeat protein [Methanosphaera sp. ISO3-F5]WQH63940.1 Ig-like domain repeat protein [Methanosphaera sp. ISO3-F5]